MLQVALELAATRAEGPGLRYAVWLQGCPLRCPGCCNPEFLPFAGGQAVPVAALRARVLATPGLEGVSLLGGEPFAQAEAAARLLVSLRDAGLSTMVFSGFTLQELRARPEASALLEACDLLVDGRYERDKPDGRRRWIGSTNQRLHFLSPRYEPGDPRFLAADGLEIRLSDGLLTINGRPWGRGLPGRAL